MEILLTVATVPHLPSDNPIGAVVRSRLQTPDFNLSSRREELEGKGSLGSLGDRWDVLWIVSGLDQGSKVARFKGSFVPWARFASSSFFSPKHLGSRGHRIIE